MQRAFSSHEDWPQGVRATIEALFDYLAAEPAFAHLALVDARAASGRVAERAARGTTAFALMLGPGFSTGPGAKRPPP